MLLSLCAAALVFSRGTVALTVVDAHGKPIANREVWLDDTNSTKPIKPFGVQYGIPNRKPALKSKSNAAGVVKIAGVKTGKPMMVVTRLSPRFDDFVKKQTPEYEHWSMEIMRFEGAVYAGKPAKIVVADDYAIEGTVTDAQTGAPVADVPIALSDTGIGHMSGYPGTTIDETKTDANGHYAFRKLPNCIFEVDASPNGSSFGVESKTGNEPWQFRLLVNSKGEWAGSASAGVFLKSPLTRFDFRVSKTAQIDVTVKRGTQKTLRGWSLFPYMKDASGATGRVLDYPDPNKPPHGPIDEDTAEFQLLPGTYKMVLQPEWEIRKKFPKDEYVAGLVELKPGEHRKVVYVLSDVVGPSKKK